MYLPTVDPMVLVNSVGDEWIPNGGLPACETLQGNWMETLYSSFPPLPSSLPPFLSILFFLSLSLSLSLLSLSR